MQETVPVDGGMLDLELLGHRTRLELLTALQAQRARLDAHEHRLLHALATDPIPGDYGFADGSTHWRSPIGHDYTRPPDERPIDTTTVDPIGDDPPPY